MRLSIPKIKKIYSFLFIFDNNYSFGLAFFSFYFVILLNGSCIFHYSCYFLYISRSIDLKIGWKSHEAQRDGSNLILLFTCPTNQFYKPSGESRTLNTFLEFGTTYLVLRNKKKLIIIYLDIYIYLSIYLSIYIYIFWNVIIRR